jgi:hypothetical protein
MDVVRIEDEDDVRKERFRIRNAKCTERRNCAIEQQQRQLGNIYDFSTTDLRNIINIGRDGCNVIMARQQSMPKWKPTTLPITTFLQITRAQLRSAS